MARVVDIRGLPETQKLLASFTDRQLNNRVRQATRAGAKVFRQGLRRKGSESQYPSTFRKTRTRSKRNPVGTSVGTASSLANIYESGASSHRIGGTGQILHSQQGEPLFAARGPVTHPGMGARPLVGPVWDLTRDKAEKAAVDKLFEEFPTPVVGFE